MKWNDKYTTCPCCGQIRGKNSCRPEYKEIVGGLRRDVDALRDVVGELDNLGGDKADRVSMLAYRAYRNADRALLQWVLWGEKETLPCGSGVGGRFNAWEPNGVRA